MWPFPRLSQWSYLRNCFSRRISRLHYWHVDLTISRIFELCPTTMKGRVRFVPSELVVANSVPFVLHNSFDFFSHVTESE